jgi:hypothetical protein
MKIPESIRIAGVDYKIEFVPNLNNGTQLAYGFIDFENSVISLSDTYGTGHQKRCQILWHEILHGIREANGMEIENEEAIVDMFAKGIYQVLQDNGRKLFDIVDENNVTYCFDDKLVQFQHKGVAESRVITNKSI